MNAVYDYLDRDGRRLPIWCRGWHRRGTLSDDGLVYTLQLRDDAAWHDGSPVTVDDVLGTIQWHREAESTLASLIAAASFEDAGDNQITITLSEPNPDFLYNLTDNKFVILKSGAENIGVEFNGSGPFVLEEIIAGDRAILRANESYWRGAPSIDRLEFIFFDDQQAGIAAVQGGTADGIMRLDNSSFLGFSGDMQTSRPRTSPPAGTT